MNENRRMSSIARRMGRSWTMRLFWIFAVLDVAIIGLLVGGYCYAMEIDQLGRFETVRPRSLRIEQTLDNIEAMIDSAEYSVFDDEGTEHTYRLGGFLRTTAPMLIGLLAIELLILMCQSSAGRRSANRVLKPIIQMTRSAQRLSEAPLMSARVQSLEHAIESIKTDAPGAKLITGDRELKGLEGAINDLLERTHASYREQLRFVSDASHELRTPIAVIQGYSSMLERWGRQDEAILDESIQAINGEAAHMNKLVEQLLFLARGDGGRMELALESVSLTEMIHEVFEEYRMIDTAHEYQFSSAGTVECVLDSAMVKQVARILTDNARRYTPEGGAIMLRVLDGKHPGFQVQDSGIGIAQDDLPHIFERFYRSDPARTRASGGTGLGLSIAKWIVDRHGGYFDVMSSQGLGTRMTVHLPRLELPKKAA